MTFAGLSRTPVFALACCLVGCAGPAVSTPRTGILAPRVSEAQEVRAGQRAAREATRALGVVADQELLDYVQQVGARIAAVSDRSQLPWTFRVVDDPMPNAFGLPGGYVFVTRGMLGVLGSEAELAAVLAHEVAHVTARHGVQSLARASGTEIGMWAVPVSDIRSLDAGSVVGAGLLFREHGPEAERQADDLAFRYMLAAGYDVREVRPVFAALGRISTMGGRSALPPWMATHPDPGGRLETAAARAANVDDADSLRQFRIEYVEQIEDLVYGQDPRQGVFRGSTFIHPNLRFQVDLPAGWRYRKLTQVVVATSPEGDAGMQLTVLDEGAAAEVAERFVAQAGIRATGPLQTDALNDNLVLTQPFEMTSGARNVEGVVSWVRSGGRTYQIVSVGNPQAPDGNAAAARAVARSFVAVNDARLLQLRPNRINIVRLGRATTFDDFNRRYPSVVDSEEIALLNRVAGGSTRLRAGDRMKRIVRG